MAYAEFDAAIAAGATLTELQEWDRGKTFTIAFKEKIVAWHKLHNLIGAHSQDAARAKAAKQGKGRR